MVYISGPLQAAEDLQSARRLYERLARISDDRGFQPYLPHQRTDPDKHQDVSPGEVFRTDLDALRSADLIIAVVGAPSSGVGAELALAYIGRQPVIALCHEDERLSRFIEGMLADHRSALLLRYRSQQHLEQQLIRSLEQVRSELPHPVG
ncbi:MAG: hypothetical protein JWO74_1578 [Solirubrobacterales bacterium]|nr:hypothetical protein [Solirubrobacterales bacterium]